MSSSLNIEIFCAPNCNRCGRAVELVRQVSLDLHNTHIQWRKINVVEEIDYAVSLGVRSTPSIAINGKLVFTATPNEQELQDKLLALIHV